MQLNRDRRGQTTRRGGQSCIEIEIQAITVNHLFNHELAMTDTCTLWLKDYFNDLNSTSFPSVVYVACAEISRAGRK